MGVPVIDSSIDILAVTEAREERVAEGESVFSAVELDDRLDLLEYVSDGVPEGLCVEIPLPEPEKLDLELPEELADTVLETVEETVNVLRPDIELLCVGLNEERLVNELDELGEILRVEVTVGVVDGEEVEVRLVVIEGVPVLDTIEVFVLEVVGLMLRVPVIERVLDGELEEVRLEV